MYLTVLMRIIFLICIFKAKVENNINNNKKQINLVAREMKYKYKFEDIFQ